MKGTADSVRYFAGPKICELQPCGNQLRSVKDTSADVILSGPQQRAPRIICVPKLQIGGNVESFNRDEHGPLEKVNRNIMCPQRIRRPLADSKEGQYV